MNSNVLVIPMREDLTKLGIEELRTAEEVDEVFSNQKGTTLLVINSVCGCAAGNARPGIKIAMNHHVLPDNLTTVFAGQDQEATDQARSYLPGYPPSSPSIALFKQGQLVEMIQRHQIEGRTPEEIANDLTEAFDKHCG
ncbi:MAG: BrxA/BrxB family bacilliredoxin [Calditrichia bacterium]|nr:BrxA/BrxB family bacilliredoxin [Calditrichia bacterium]